MCGRFNLRAPSHQLVDFFDLGEIEFPDTPPRFNIAPTQPVFAIRDDGGRREPTFLQWGLVPYWSKDPKMGARMINARGETVATKPAFRAAFKRRRCLIPASGFYEWKKLDAKNKQPYHIHFADDSIMTFAGLWEHWESADGSVIQSCTVITTAANSLMSTLHDRMPVILDKSNFDRWLTTPEEQSGDLEQLLIPFPAESLEAYEVSNAVGNYRNNSIECIQPFEGDALGLPFSGHM